MGRERAVARIDANIKPFEDAVKRAKAEIRLLEGMQAEAKLTGDDSDLSEAIREARLKLKALDGEKADVEIRYHTDRIAAKQALEDLKLLQAAERERAKLAAASERALVRDAAFRRRISLDHANALKMDMRRQQLLDSEPLKVAKAQAQVTRLYNEYTKATKAVERLARTRVPLGREGRAEHVAAVAGARAKLELLKAQLNALGAHPPVEIKVDTDIDRGRIKRRMFLLKESLKTGLDKVGSLGDLTARFGPFTASLKQIGLALAVLGPTITDLLGGAGALVGVLGTGIAGAASVGGAALLGFGQAGLGVFMALKPVISEFQTLNQLSAALTKAQLKYGAGSKQAGHAQGQLNRALRGVGPVTRQAFVDLTRLRTAWQKATGPTANRTFGHILAQGVKTAGELLPQFSAQTNKTLEGLDRGTTKWLKGLRSAEGKGILDTTFKNANLALGPFMAGLGSLATMFGRIAQSASKLLPSLSQGFAKWAQGLADGVSNGARVDAVMQRLVHHMQDLGHWAMSLGRLLTTVFNGGADAGDSMIQHMTATFDRWNNDLKADGGKGLRDFFSRAVKGTEALASALAPVIRAFIGLSTNLSPFVTGIFQGVAAMGKLANAVLDVTALRGPVAALGSAFAVAFSITRIGKFVDLVQRAGQLVRAQGLAKGLGMILTGKGGIFGGPAAGLSGTAAAVEISTAMEGAGASVSAMIRAAMIQGGMAAAGEEAAAISGAGAMAGVSKGGVALPKGVKTVAPVAGGAAAAGATSALAGSGLAAAAASTAVSLGITAVGAAALYGAYKLATMKTASEKLTERLHKLDNVTGEVAGTTQAFADNGAQLPKAQHDLASSINSVIKAKRHLTALDKAGKRDTQEYRDGVYALNQQLQLRAQRQQQVRTLTADKINAGLDLNQKLRPKQVDAEKLVRDAKREYMERKQAVDSLDESLRAQGFTEKHIAKARRDAIAPGSNLSKAEAQLALARNRLHDINEQFRASENSKNAVLANSKRLMEGMIQLTGKQEQQVGRLAKVAPKTAVKISTKFVDPVDAGNVAAAARKSIGKVSVTTINKIVADSSSADQAIARLKAARITSRWRVIESGGKAALALAERLNGKRRLSDAQKRIITRGGPQALAEIGRIDRRKFSPKNIVIQARAEQALTAAAAVRDAINNIPGFKDIYIRAHKSAAALTGGTARGGGEQFGRGPASDYVSARASSQADRKSWERFATAGRVSSPTYLVGEEGTSEFVISSNPTYRRRNRSILAEAARTIGWPSGVVAAKKGSQVTAHPGLPASVTTLPVPDPYSVAGVDETAAETSVTAWRSEKSRRKGLLASIRKQKAAEQKEWNKKKGKATKAEKEAHAKKMARLNSDHRDLVNGLSPDDTGDPIRTIPYAKVTLAVTKGGKDLARLKHANADIAHENAEIAADRTRMDRMASIYASANSSAAQKAKAKTEYTRVKANRISSIKRLLKMLGRAKAAAEALAQMAPWSDKLRATLDGITGSNEDALSELNTSENEPDATNAPDTAETFIERIGLTKALKDRLLAQATATTTATTADDEAARQSLFDLYGKQIIPAALADPAVKENTDLLTELYNAQGSYAPGAVSDDPQVQAIAEQAKQREHFAAVSGLIDKTFGYVSATMPGLTGGRRAASEMGASPATPYTPTSLRDAANRPRQESKDAGVAGGNVTVNFNALTANPQQARQAADVIVGGIGYQGGRSASSTQMGA